MYIYVYVYIYACIYIYNMDIYMHDIRKCIMALYTCKHTCKHKYTSMWEGYWKNFGFLNQGKAYKYPGKQRIKINASKITHGRWSKV